jgi:jumonji domain-containing protein 7
VLCPRAAANAPKLTHWLCVRTPALGAVVAGSKTFSLMPPADLYRMRLRRYGLATYEPCSSSGSRGEESGAGARTEQTTSSAVALQPVLDPAGQQVLWSSVQPEADTPAAAEPTTVAAAESAAAAATQEGAAEPAQNLFSDPSLPPPLRVTVRAGETLYLPAMWWHQVRLPTCLPACLAVCLRQGPARCLPTITRLPRG